MRKIVILSFMIVALLLSACSSSLKLGGEDANYLKNYNFPFSLKQDLRGGTKEVVLQNRKDFDKYFSGTTLVGGSAQSTGSILDRRNWVYPKDYYDDFDNYFLVGVIIPKTSRNTDIKTVSLKRIGNKLYYSYVIVEGAPLQYKRSAFIMLQVDRSEPTNVVFQRMTMQDLEKAGISIRDILR